MISNESPLTRQVLDALSNCGDPYGKANGLLAILSGLPIAAEKATAIEVALGIPKVPPEGADDETGPQPALLFSDSELEAAHEVLKRLAEAKTIGLCSIFHADPPPTMAAVCAHMLAEIETLNQNGPVVQTLYLAAMLESGHTPFVDGNASNGYSSPSAAALRAFILQHPAEYARFGAAMTTGDSGKIAAAVSEIFEGPLTPEMRRVLIYSAVCTVASNERALGRQEGRQAAQVEAQLDAILSRAMSGAGLGQEGVETPPEGPRRDPLSRRRRPSGTN